jgi:hypothetical protein
MVNLRAVCCTHLTFLQIDKNCFFAIVENGYAALPLIADLEEAFTCHIQRRNTKRGEREVAIWAVLANDS